MLTKIISLPCQGLFSFKYHTGRSEKSAKASSVLLLICTGVLVINRPRWIPLEEISLRSCVVDLRYAGSPLCQKLLGAFVKEELYHFNVDTQLEEYESAVQQSVYSILMSINLNLKCFSQDDTHAVPHLSSIFSSDSFIISKPFFTVVDINAIATIIHTPCCYAHVTISFSMLCVLFWLVQ